MLNFGGVHFLACPAWQPQLEAKLITGIVLQQLHGLKAFA